MKMSNVNMISVTQPPELGAWSHLPRPDLILKEAFVDAPDRITKQLSIVTGMSEQEVTHIMQEARMGGSGDITIHVLHVFSFLVDCSLYYYHGGHLRSFAQRRNRNKSSIVMAEWAGHAYFYSEAGFAAKAAVGKPHLEAIVIDQGALADDRFQLTMPETKTVSNPATSILEKSMRRITVETQIPDFPWGLAAEDFALVAPGSYHIKSEDGPETETFGRTLEDLVALMVQNNRFPKVKYQRFPPKQKASIGPIDKPVELTYYRTKRDGGRGVVKVRSHARDASQTRQWAHNLGIPYAGQGLGGFTNTALDVLLRLRVRKYLSGPMKQELVREQNNSCKLCGDTLGEDIIFDHTIPLHQMRVPQNKNTFQAICGQCSANKTATETRPSLGVLQSHFTKIVWESYVESPLPPCITYKDANVPDMPCTAKLSHGYEMLDIIRSRRSALYYSVAIPIFSPLDNIEPITPSEGLPDLVYVEKTINPQNITELVKCLPYLGPGWYHKVSIEYCLHVRKLEWPDLKWGITASAHYPSDQLRAALDVMEEAWGEVQIQDEGDKPAKRSVNTMVGFWGMQQSVQISSILSFGNLGEALYGNEVLERRDAFGVPGLVEYRRCTRVKTSATYRPLYDLCLCTEHTRLAQAYQALMSAFEPRFPPQIVNITVDGIIWKSPRKAATREKVHEVLSTISFGNLPTLEDHIRQCLTKADPKQKRLKISSLHPVTVFTAPAPVLRLGTPEERQHLRGNYDIGKIMRSWEFPDFDLGWVDLSESQAEDTIISGDSCLVQGIAGTGKSYFIRERVLPKLKAQGKRIISIAKTHCAARVAGGVTADHFAWRHIREGGTNVDIIWVDEISLLDIELLQELNHLTFREPPVTWLLSGDFNQYAPFFNTFRGEPVTKSLENAHLLDLMAMGNRLTLTECKRSDPILFNWYSSLAEGGLRYTWDLCKNVAEARLMFTEDNAEGFIPGTKLAPINFAISHKTRVAINASCNEADRIGKNEIVRINREQFDMKCETKGVNNPQGAWFWPGLKVVACKTTKNLKNGVGYKITNISESHDKVMLESWVRLEPGSNENTDDESEHGSNDLGGTTEDIADQIELSKFDFFKCLRLPYCVTLASIQGITVDGLCAVHDTDHIHFTPKMLFVALSRARSHSQIIVY
jgi:hypothetical protein